jgi:hypothetical protein
MRRWCSDGRYRSPRQRVTPGSGSSRYPHRADILAPPLLLSGPGDPGNRARGHQARSRGNGNRLPFGQRPGDVDLRPRRLRRTRLVLQQVDIRAPCSCRGSGDDRADHEPAAADGAGSRSRQGGRRRRACRRPWRGCRHSLSRMRGRHGHRGRRRAGGADSRQGGTFGRRRGGQRGSSSAGHGLPNVQGGGGRGLARLRGGRSRRTCRRLACGRARLPTCPQAGHGAACASGAGCRLGGCCGGARAPGRGAACQRRGEEEGGSSVSVHRQVTPHPSVWCTGVSCCSRAVTDVPS